jgi:carbon monoxide dehydrogenase subunit G
MAGRELTVRRLVRAAPEDVWSVITDVEHAAQTLRGVSRVELLDGPGYAVGTRWRETRKMFGKDETQTLEVAACDPPRSTTVTSRSAGVEYRSVFTLEPVDEGTLVSVCFGASHPDPNLLQRLTFAVFGHVGSAITTRLLSQDLADIAASAED